LIFVGQQYSFRRSKPCSRALSGGEGPTVERQLFDIVFRCGAPTAAKFKRSILASSEFQDG
jgi:hypothetical protein